MKGFFLGVLGLFGSIALLIGLIALIVLGIGGCNNWQRGQHLKNVRNSVKANHIRIQFYSQQKQIEQQKADIRVIHAIGIRKAQDHISKTLTPLYVQWEAIQAEQAMAMSGKNNTMVYIPSGAQGVPLVAPTGVQTFPSGGK
jgi:hypothetical protein